MEKKKTPCKYKEVLSESGQLWFVYSRREQIIKKGWRRSFSLPIEEVLHKSPHLC